MGLFSFFKRAAADGHGARVRRAVPPQDPATLEVLRTRARRRLIGAAVLVAAAVIAVPMALETQPRPGAQWTGEVAFTTMNSPSGSADGVRVAAAPSREGADSAPAASAPAVDRPAVKAVVPKASEARVAVVVPKVKVADPVKAKASDPAKTAESPAKPEVKEGVSPSGRYVVQVGAYSKMDSVEEVRGRIQKLGLHSVYNTVETPQGQRIRVRLGPFTSRESADRAMAQLKAGGIRAQVLTWEASR